MRGRIQKADVLISSEFLTGSAPIIPAGQIDRGAPNGCDQERLGIAGQMPLVPPKPDEGFLHDVFGIREATRPLPRTKQQFGSVVLKPIFPRFII